ncbi:hypothetical protein [Puia dinghuensis]|uniref:Uncharacterized protein n=1 Tax=Puia dinghuensis TaxID=1792502 RepID=A0A8J2UJB5_9BACT|nr:hypothetical protein [Puia dinghuensis]GGB26213.1 hypothetical protein GCM10011511_57740 [Puia dinghuensis]
MKCSLLFGAMLLLLESLMSQDNINLKYSLLVKEGVFSRAFIRIRPLSIAGFRLIGKRAFAMIDKDTLETPGLSEIEIRLYRGLIYDASVMDTTSWRDGELPSCVIVPSNGRVSKKYAISKLKPETKDDKIFFNKLVYSFNKSGGNKKWLYSFSRPVIDSSGNYAIIADTSAGNNFGCFFYKWNGLKWQEMLNISTRD